MRKFYQKGDLLGYDLSLRYACIVGDFTTGFSETSWREEKDQPGHSSLHSLNYYIQKRNNVCRTAIKSRNDVIV